MPTVTIPAGTLHYRTAGPADSTAPARRVRPRLPRRQPPVGPRRRPPRRPGRALVPRRLAARQPPHADGADADLSPAGVAAMIDDVLAALGLDDVTLVGNDTGGASASCCWPPTRAASAASC